MNDIRCRGRGPTGARRRRGSAAFLGGCQSNRPDGRISEFG